MKWNEYEKLPFVFRIVGEILKKKYWKYLEKNTSLIKYFQIGNIGSFRGKNGSIKIIWGVFIYFFKIVIEMLKIKIVFSNIFINLYFD